MINFAICCAPFCLWTCLSHLLPEQHNIMCCRRQVPTLYAAVYPIFRRLRLWH